MRHLLAHRKKNKEKQNLVVGYLEDGVFLSANQDHPVMHVKRSDLSGSACGGGLVEVDRS